MEKLLRFTIRVLTRDTSLLVEGSHPPMALLMNDPSQTSAAHLQTIHGTPVCHVTVAENGCSTGCLYSNSVAPPTKICRMAAQGSATMAS